MVRLEEFLRSGEFGPVRIGMSRDQLLLTLGEPERLGGTSSSQPVPLIWKYGDVEFHFDLRTGLLALVYADSFSTPRGALGLQVEAGWLLGGLGLDEGLARLASADLAHAMRVPDYDPGHAVLELESGVLLGFNVEARPDRGKRGLVFFSQGPR